MKIKIKNIAAVQMGYSFRSRLEASTGGDVAVIQMKDLLDDNTVNGNSLMKIDKEVVKDHHLAQKGDLIFRTRGHVSTTAIILEDLVKAIIAAPLIRIRITKPGKILPEYLNWYISQRDAQVFLTSRADGTAQKMINKQVIEDIEVALPSLEQQRKIVEIALLSAREQTILSRLAEKRDQYIRAALMRVAEGDKYE
ncbi:MAG: restriction endonuclease subunit S [Gammaproteobacteria bacterium]|nr:restriction endonuclease subunit S [Gammaproteobacteria bacterium]